MAWYQRMAQRRPSFLIGMASLLDLFGILSSSPQMRRDYYKPLYDDTEAIASDWSAVGKDMRAAFMQYDQAVK
jgi:hypothetical protein